MQISIKISLKFVVARWSSQWRVTTTLGAFSDIIHEFCNDRFGTEERAAKRPKQLNWHEVQKGKLRPQHRALRKQRKEVPVVEREGTIVPIDDLRKEQNTKIPKKEKQWKAATRRQILLRPIFTTSLFELNTSGSLKVPCSVLNDHLNKTYSDPDKAGL